VAFDELDSSQQLEDSHGIKIVSAILYNNPQDHRGEVGEPVELHVVGDVLSANLAGHPDRPLTDEALKRTIITLLVRRDTGSLAFELKIDDIDRQRLHFWAGTPEVVPSYLIFARQIHTDNPAHLQFEHICKSTPSTTEARWQGADYYAIAFAGDRYHAAEKTVEDARPGDTWFNLACAGTAPAKMHLMRHTNAGAGRDRTYATTLDERNSMLKMFTADYCGTGQAFTVDGQPLLWGDARHWYPDTPSSRLDGTSSVPESSVEALWTAEGAACVNTPRRAPRECVPCLQGEHSIPSCTSKQVRYWERRYHVISVNRAVSTRR
jgi:hypothetical protein